MDLSPGDRRRGPGDATNPRPVPRSDCAGIRWPAVPRGANAQLLALAYQFDDSQWWPAGTVAAHQLSQLEPLLAHAARTVPFYRDRLRVLAGIKAGGLTMEAFRRIPVFERAHIQEAGDALHSTRVPEDHEPVTDASTSGSTGRPITVRKTAVTSLLYTALNLRFHLWHGRDMAGHAAAIQSLHGDLARIAEAGETRPWVPGYPAGPMSLLSISTPVGQQLDWLRRQDPHYLLTLPSNLRALLQLSAKGGVRLPRLREVITMAEMLEPDVRELCTEVWGVPVTDIYSCEEVGVIALQCPGHAHYHVQEESVLVEVLDDDGGPSAPGQVGRVVLTDLHNFAAPLIRYQNGDYAEAGAPCPCGRGLAVLNRVVGRTRNMLTLPSGDKQWPNLPSATLARLAPIGQLQLVQTTVQDIEVRLVMARPLTPAEETALTDFLTASFGHPFTYAITYVDEIERTPGGKFEAVISRLGD
jgi:phenylacetate-CoA ligase